MMLLCLPSTNSRSNFVLVLLQLLAVQCWLSTLDQQQEPSNLVRSFCIVKPFTVSNRRQRQNHHSTGSSRIGAIRNGANKQNYNNNENNNNNNNNGNNHLFSIEMSRFDAPSNTLTNVSSVDDDQSSLSPSSQFPTTGVTSNTSTGTDYHGTSSKTTTTRILPIFRGGGKLTKDKPDLFTSTKMYWQTSFRTVIQTLVVQPYRTITNKVSTMMKSKETLEEEEMIHRIRTMKVQTVVVPNTTVLPKDVIDIAAKRTSLIGNPLRTEYVQDFAQSMKRWYIRNGYLLHSVTGATLQSETATVEISVQEPIHHTIPVHISFYKEMIIDPDTGNLTTYKQFKDKHIRRQSFGLEEKINKQNLNITYVPAIHGGYVKANKIAKALHMIPGQPFTWDPMKWNRIYQSGLFSRILGISPRSMVVDKSSLSSQHNTNAVQIHIDAIEAPTKHLEYGIGKNLYTNGWEGEFDFEHMNILGGGETLGINVRRGTLDSKPSIKCKYSTGRLNSVGGYDIEAFNEYIGHSTSIKKNDLNENGVKASTTAQYPLPNGDNVNNGDSTQTSNKKINAIPTAKDTNDAQFDRRGATIRIRNPIDPNTIRNSVVSASIERTASSDFGRTGICETIGSTTMEVGPFLRELPYDARSNFDLSITTGARFGFGLRKRKQDTLLSSISRSGTTGDDNEHDKDTSNYDIQPISSSDHASSSNDIVPYITMSATTRQLFPFLNSRNRDRNRLTAKNAIDSNSNFDSSQLLQQQNQLSNTHPSARTGRPLVLALKHTIIVSSDTLPSHVGKAISTSTNVRGAKIAPDQQQCVTSALRGTTELRVPLYIPIFERSLNRNNMEPNIFQKIFQQTTEDANVVFYSDWLVSLNNEQSKYPSITGRRSAEVNSKLDPTSNSIDDGSTTIPISSSSSSPISSNSMFNRQSCIGIGLRKSIQGIPLQYDVTYNTKDGHIRSMFGLGRDFVF